MNYKWRCVLQWVITSYHMISWIGLDWIGLQLDSFGLLVAFFWWGKLAVLFWTRNQLVHVQYPNGKATDQSFKRFGNSKCTNWRRHVQSQTFGNLHHFFLLAKLSQVWKKKKLLKYWAIDKFEATQLEKLLNWNNSTSLPRNIDNTKRDAVFELQVCLRLIRDGLSCEEYSGVNYAIR